MTAHVVIKARAPPLVDVLEARAHARAWLFAAGEIATLPDAVDPLQAWAVAVGLVAAIGQDAVQQILSKAFAEARQ
jgi:hypothetical protein